MKTAGLSFILPLFFLIPVKKNSDYIQYYNLTNDAEQFMLEGDFSEAFKSIVSAFDLVPYVHTEKLFLGAKIAVNNQDFSQAHKFLNSACEQGLTLEQIRQDLDFASFIKTSDFRKLERKFKRYARHFEEAINVEYSDKIDSLYFVDQFILRDSKETPTKSYKVSKTDIQSMDGDAVIFSSLLELIEDYGFPTERFVRKSSLHAAYVIIHHNARLPKNESFLNELKNRLTEGEYHPFWYAWALDQQHFFYKKERPVFFCGIPLDAFSLSAEEINDIDLKRKEIGMESLKLQELRKRQVIVDK